MMEIDSPSLRALAKLNAEMRGRANIPRPIPPEVLCRYREETVRLMVAANRELTPAPR